MKIFKKGIDKNKKLLYNTIGHYEKEVGSMVLLDITGAMYQGTSNIRFLKNVFFSLKNRKFIKPIKRIGDSVSGYFMYNLLPGSYVVMSYDYWTKRYPSVIFTISTISLVQITSNDTQRKEYVQEVKKKVELIYNNGTTQRQEILKDFEKLIVLTNDFVKAVPTYHVPAGVFDLAKKIYDDETVTELLRFVDINNGKSLYYQPEID
jgi:hypothetical protein